MSTLSQCNWFLTRLFLAFILKTHTCARCAPARRSLARPFTARSVQWGSAPLRSSSDAGSPPFSGLAVAVWRYRRSKKREQVCKHVTARSSNMTVSCGERKMDSVVKNTQKKLWLCGLLWWSLLLELASGGNSETLPLFSQWKHTPSELISWCFVRRFLFCFVFTININVAIAVLVIFDEFIQVIGVCWGNCFTLKFTCQIKPPF